MLVTLLSWAVIALSAFLCGFGIIRGILDRGKAGFRRPDLYIMVGLCFLTVYAQAFSLFYKVGSMAVAGVAILCVIVLVVLYRPLLHFAEELVRGRKILWCVVAVLLIGAVVIAMTVRYTAHYDTDLYHAQSIRWLEEYGIVKGLGNLHNRFAYNSAFMSLQALFSLKFAANRSLHTLNGFIALLMLTYAVTTLSLFRKRKPGMSDLFKLGMVFYFCFTEARLVLSSPGSDLLALSLVLYLCAEWSELTEEGCREPVEYGLLCLLAVWAATVKLSVGALVLLAVYPACLLIKARKWKKIGFFLGAGLLIVLPFLCRNVIISGYLLYPYEAIDLFDVDWKMPASIPADDRREIAAWGRGMTSREDYDAPPEKWFPVWYGRLSAGFRALMWVNMLCLAALPFYTVWTVRRGKRWAVLNLTLVGGAGFGMWFAASPLMRYGVVWLLLLPAVFIGMALEKPGRAAVAGHALAVVFLSYSLYSYGGFAAGYGTPPLIWPEHYNFRENKAVEWNGRIIYVGSGSDSVGYHDFPGTTGLERLDILELRGQDWKDGFRIKEEYRDKNITTAGVVPKDML